MAQVEVEERVEEEGRSPQTWVEINCISSPSTPMVTIDKIFLVLPWGAGAIWSRSDPLVQAGAVVALYCVGIVDSDSRHVGKGSS